MLFQAVATLKLSNDYFKDVFDLKADWKHLLRIERALSIIMVLSVPKAFGSAQVPLFPRHNSSDPHCMAHRSFKTIWCYWATSPDKITSVQDQVRLQGYRFVLALVLTLYLSQASRCNQIQFSSPVSLSLPVFCSCLYPWTSGDSKYIGRV